MITESPLKCSINNGHKSRSWLKFSIHNGRAARKLCAVSDSGDGACVHRRLGSSSSGGAMRRRHTWRFETVEYDTCTISHALKQFAYMYKHSRGVRV